jgi:hypothetical protein
MHGPADEARRSEPLQAIWVGCIGLGGVRSDDLKIMPVAERKQGVARAAPRMGAAESRGNAGVLLDKGDPLVEVAGAEREPSRMWSSTVGTSGALKEIAGDASAPPATARNDLRDSICVFIAAAAIPDSILSMNVIGAEPRPQVSCDPCALVHPRNGRCSLSAPHNIFGGGGPGNPRPISGV